MKEFLKKLRLYRLPDPRTLFECSDQYEWVQKECTCGTYVLAESNGAAAYEQYGKILSDAGFRLRCCMEHASVWLKNALMVVMEYTIDSTTSFFRLSFVAPAVQKKIYHDSDLSKVFQVDFQNNAKWIQINRWKPYFILLSYRGEDFSRNHFKTVLIRFADFYRCNFGNSSWHACRLNLFVDGGRLACNFTNCNFSGSTFVGVDFSGCFFRKCNFLNCVFRNCKFVDTVMEDCLLEDFDILKCKTDSLAMYYTEGCNLEIE